MFLLAPLYFVAGWLLYTTLLLFRNYHRARRMRVPIKVLPVSPTNPLWLVFEPAIMTLLEKLPFSVGNVTRYGRRGWHFQEKARSHLQAGDVWCMVTPQEIFLHICDAQAIEEIFRRREDFVRPVEMYRLLDIYGPCVATVEGKRWQTHRRLLAGAFNGKVKSNVWDESSRQAGEALTAWEARQRDDAAGLAQDTRSLSLNVLAATVFGQPQQFQASSENVMSHVGFREALTVVMDNAHLLMIMPDCVLKARLIPEWCKRLEKAKQNLKTYMQGVIHSESPRYEAKRSSTGSLVAQMMRVPEQEAAMDVNHSKIFAQTRTSKPAESESVILQNLRIDEILGNIFVINFAGHDTTANTLAYIIFLLAANPAFQDWLHEEIDHVFDILNVEDWSYNEHFSQLKRCQAVMLETLRLYPPILSIPKRTVTRQTLHVSNRNIDIAANVIVSPALLAIQTHPRQWGLNALEWRPDRWISSPATASIPRGSLSIVGGAPFPSETSYSRSSGDASPSNLKTEDLLNPPKGTYFPWSSGPQNCPGAKFSQVEIVAVIARLMRDHRVMPALRDGETVGEAQKRLMGVCEDSGMVMLLKMRGADGVGLRWEKRRTE